VRRDARWLQAAGLCTSASAGACRQRRAGEGLCVTTARWRLFAAACTLFSLVKNGGASVVRRSRLGARHPRVPLSHHCAFASLVKKKKEEEIQTFVS